MSWEWTGGVLSTVSGVEGEARVRLAPKEFLLLSQVALSLSWLDQGRDKVLGSPQGNLGEALWQSEPSELD